MGNSISSSLRPAASAAAVLFCACLMASVYSRGNFYRASVGFSIECKHYGNLDSAINLLGTPQAPACCPVPVQAPESSALVLCIS